MTLTFKNYICKRIDIIKYRKNNFLYLKNFLTIVLKFGARGGRKAYNGPPTSHPATRGVRLD